MARTWNGSCPESSAGAVGCDRRSGFVPCAVKLMHPAKLAGQWRRAALSPDVALRVRG
jgi:hypothetical protein